MKKGSSSTKHKEAIAANYMVIFASMNAFTVGRLLYAHPHMQILPEHFADSPRSHNILFFSHSSWRSSKSMESQLETGALHLKDINAASHSSFFSTHKGSQASTRTTRDLRTPGGVDKDLLLVYLVVWGELCFGLVMPQKRLILWVDWNLLLR